MVQEERLVSMIIDWHIQSQKYEGSKLLQNHRHQIDLIPSSDTNQVKKIHC